MKKALIFMLFLTICLVTSACAESTASTTPTEVPTEAVTEAPTSAATDPAINSEPFNWNAVPDGLSSDCGCVMEEDCDF